MNKYNKIKVEPISGAIGADIFNVDISQPLDREVFQELRSAFLEYLVICIRDQQLEPRTQLNFAKLFGEPMIYPFVKGLDHYPQVTPVIKEKTDLINFGGLWHSDTSYEATPPLGTMLYARELPPFGGDTEFANMYLAYETLSSGLKKVLGNLVAVNISGKGRVQNTRAPMRNLASTGKDETSFVAEHPVIRTHPTTGKKSLYVNTAHTSHFKGMTVDESTPLLNYLFQHQTQLELTGRVKWKLGTLTFWDNRCTQHNPLNDYHGYRREMHRVTLKGDIPK
ncbi:TauD/TfdA family dioxygenase [Alphaproteobacteria bacterium]|nr:TauD/TfdA family dioxygenase [Alphaproteobacteria bacterium]